MWGPLVINWFINPINYSYKYHKSWLLELIQFLQSTVQHPATPSIWCEKHPCASKKPVTLAKKTVDWQNFPSYRRPVELNGEHILFQTDSHLVLSPSMTGTWPWVSRDCFEGITASFTTLSMFTNLAILGAPHCTTYDIN